jgi:hypothetical protein
VERLTKRIAIWIVIGFLVPVFWGIMGFIYFNAPQSKWTDLYWNIVYITCPPWLLPEAPYAWLSSLETPIANAILYGLIAFIISVAINRFGKRRGSD